MAQWLERRSFSMQVLKVVGLNPTAVHWLLGVVGPPDVLRPAYKLRAVIAAQHYPKAQIMWPSVSLTCVRLVIFLQPVSQKVM